MNELPDTIADRINDLCEQGNVLLEDRNDPAAAMAVWKEAHALLPEAHRDGDEALWLNTSIAEACRMLGRHEDARSYLFDAMNCADGIANPFVLLRMGQTMIDLQEVDRGVEYLQRAYMMEGDALFEDAKDYRQLLEARGLIN